MKTLMRVLKYVVVSVFFLLAVVLIYISFGFSKMEFNDDFKANVSYTNYYPDNYLEARDRFREMAIDLSAKYPNIEWFEIRVPSEIDPDLTLGVCHLPAQNVGGNLFILSSGVHGVEGYAGHAAQELFVDKFLNDDLLQKTGVLLIHSLNPYGFKHIRRVTENNVDLNRNSSINPDLYQTQNEGYPKVYGLINPQYRVNVKSLGNRFFFFKAINEIRKASLPVLRQAVLQGQYKFPEGLYFGGQKQEPQIDSLQAHIKRIIEPYSRIMMVDIHTGYGERGKLHLFPNPLEGEERKQLEEMYEGFEIDWGDSDDFYTVTGDFAGFVNALAGDRVFYPMTFEYGTLNSQTTMGSLKSIHIMILENQGKQFGYKSAKDSIKVKTDLQEMYLPKSESWRNHVMEQTYDVFKAVLPRFVDLQVE
jgi:hypothetical protein